MPSSPTDFSESMSKTCFIPNPVQDEDRMNHIMHRLAALCKSRGILFKSLFQDFERGASASPSRTNPTRGGKCTVSQFKRLFPFKKEFSEDDIQYMISRYLTDGGDICFQAIHNDISEVLS